MVAVLYQSTSLFLKRSYFVFWLRCWGLYIKQMQLRMSLSAVQVNVRCPIKLSMTHLIKVERKPATLKLKTGTLLLNSVVWIAVWDSVSSVWYMYLHLGDCKSVLRVALVVHQVERIEWTEKSKSMVTNCNFSLSTKCMWFAGISDCGWINIPVPIS